MDQSELKNRTKEFAHQCIKLVLALPKNELGSHIKRQLIRCSTSVASNYRAACVAQSKADFVSKLSIVIEETDESCFWMEFIIEEKLLDEKKIVDLLKEGKELAAIFVTSRKIAKNRDPEFAIETGCCTK